MSEVEYDNMHKYIGIYRVFQSVDYDTKKSSCNSDDTFLICKNNVEIFRYDEDNLVIYFPTTNSRKKFISELKKSKIKLTLFCEGDFESTYLFNEKDMLKVCNIVKPQVKGKNIHPNSKSSIKKLVKHYNVEQLV